ncbi:hypothetical protein MMC19_001999 [Ptychographa xylographoides]|nr:hypothetical protein [Ptychographa xylographoides]
MHYSVTLAALAAFAAFPLTSADGLYSKGSAVLQLNAKNYDKLIKHSNQASIVEFYAPWCGHCKSLKPAYEKAAKSLEGLANVAAINCDDEDNKAFCGSMGVKGFPTLKTVRPTLKRGKGIMTDYQGARTAPAIVEAVKSLIPNHVKLVSDKELDEWLATDNTTAKAILFSDKGTTSALIKVLSVDYFGTINIGQIKDKDTAAVSTFGVTKYPTLVVLPGGTASAVVYSGEMAKAPMSEFLSQYAAKAAKPNTADSKQKPMKEDKAASSSHSSTFSSASAAHASAEASEAAASGSTVTLEVPNAATESPNPIVADEEDSAPVQLPDIAPPLPVLSSVSELRSECLGSRTPTCILALLPISASTDDTSQLPEPATAALASLSEISEKHKTRGSHLFPFFAVPADNEGSTLLRGTLGLAEGVQLVAINGRRSWSRLYSGAKGYGMNAVESWVDDIRMGEGKKEKLPAGLVVEEDETASETIAEAAESVTDKAGDKLAEATDKVRGATDAAKTNVADATETVEDMAMGAADSVGESAGSVTSKVGDHFESLTSVVAESAGSATSAISESAASISSIVGDAAASGTSVVGQTAGSVTSVVGESVVSAASIVGETAGSITSVVSDTAASVTSVVGETAASVTSVVGESVSSAASVAGESASSVTSIVAESGASASSVVSASSASAASEASASASSVSSVVGESLASASSVASESAASVTAKVSDAASRASSKAATTDGSGKNLGEKVGKQGDSLTEKVGEKVAEATAKAKSIVHGEL